MKLNQLITRLPALYYSALSPKGPSYYFESAPGRGKTWTLELFPKIMRRVDPKGRYGVVVINGANFTLMTSMGFMVPEKDALGRTISVFTLPYWWKTTEGRNIDEYDGVLIIVDEADKLGVDEKKIVGEAALSKRLGNHDFPAGAVVMFAGNRMADKSGSTRELRHLINRRIKIEITDDMESWADWARTEGLLPEVIDFAEDNPQLLFEPMPEDERPWCTPRSLHQMDIHLQSLMRSFDTNVIPTDPLTVEEMKGGIGAPAATGLMTKIRLGNQLHKFEEVIAAPTTISVPRTPDAQRLMAYKVASRVDDKTAKAAITYAMRMPQEHQAMFVRMAIQRNYQIAFQPDFAAWCAKHSALTAILTNYKVESK